MKNTPNTKAAQLGFVHLPTKAELKSGMVEQTRRGVDYVLRPAFYGHTVKFQWLPVGSPDELETRGRQKGPHALAWRVLECRAVLKAIDDYDNCRFADSELRDLGIAAIKEINPKSQL